MGSPKARRKTAAAVLHAWWFTAILRASWSNTAGHNSAKRRAATICTPKPLLLALPACYPLHSVAKGLRLLLGTQAGRIPSGGWSPLIVKIR